MDKRKLALLAGGLLLSLLCTQSAPATASDEMVPSFTVKQTPILLLNPRSHQLTDMRHTSKDGTTLLYDEICMDDHGGHDLRIIFYQHNQAQLMLEYFPAPAATLPTGQQEEVKCPTISSLASQIAYDSTGQYHFLDDGSLMAQSTPDYHLMPMSARAVSMLRDRIYNASDGKRQTEELFDEKHDLIKFGQRQNDGGYEETAYFPDKKIQRHRVTNKLGVVIAEEVNAPGGLPLATTVSDKENVITTTKFDIEKHMVLFHDIRVADGKESTREVYYPGTDKVRMRAKYDGSKTLAEFFRESDGTLERTQNVDAYNTTVRYMDVDGKTPLYEQVWKFTNTNHGNATDFVMSSMSILDAKGDEVMQFNVSDDHKHITQKSLRNVTVGTMTYPSVFYKYRDDGTLDEVQYITPGSLPNPPPEPHKASEGIKLDVDVNKLKHAPFEDLPVPKQINYSYHGH